MSSLLQKGVGLPTLPSKASVRLDHLAFREPGHKASEKRESCLLVEVQKQEDKLLELRQEQKDLRKQITGELETLNREPIHGQSQRKRRDVLLEKLRVQLDETKRELRLSIGLEDEETQEEEESSEEEDLQRALKRAQAERENQSVAVEIEELRERQLSRELDEISRNIDSLRQEEEKEKEKAKEEVKEEANEEVKEEVEEEAEEEAEQEAKEEAEQEVKEKAEEGVREEERTEEAEGAEGAEEEAEEIMEEKAEEDVKENTKEETKEQAKEQQRQQQEQQLVRLREQEEELQKQRKQNMETLEAKKERIMRNKKKCYEQLEEEKKKLERRDKFLKRTEELLQQRQKQRKREEEDKHEDLQMKKHEKDREEKRLGELKRQQGRSSMLETLRDSVYEPLGWHFWLRSSAPRPEYRQQLQGREKMLAQLERLEASLTESQRINQKVGCAQDLKDVLNWEINSERKLRQLSKRDSASPNAEKKAKSHQAKDHFAGSDFNIYERLVDGQIRLLILWPAPEDCYPLICTLRTESLNGSSKPRYAALSYFWGTESPEAARLYLLPHQPTGDKLDKDNWGSTSKFATQVPIRNNLFRALLQLRRTDTPIALWVDVMCINQGDMNEKTDQLRRMVDIYRSAENVCIWLGEADSAGNSDLAMEFIPTIMDFAVLDRLANDKEQAKQWNSLSELMRDRWFSRRWVVQEISLARSATLHCGGKSVQWCDFVDAVSILVSNQARIRKLFDFSAWREGPDTLGEVQSFGAYILLEATSRLFLRKANGDIGTPVKSLESLVTSLKTFDASDQRDIIYSLVSIASDTHALSESQSAEKSHDVVLPIDYNKTETDVYMDFTKFCIQSSKSLDIICRHWAMPVKNKTDKQENIELPSWIPLLSDSEFGEPEQVYGGRKNGDNLVGPFGQPRYKASGGKESDVKFNFGKNDSDQPNGVHPETNASRTDSVPASSLVVKGFVLARVKETSRRNTAGLILRESLRMGSWRGIENHTESVPDALWRTLIADRDSDGQIPPTWYQRACLRCLEMADSFNNGDLNIGQLLKGNSDMLRVYLTRVRNTTWNRKFFTADMKPSKAEDACDNGLFGLCPGTTEKDDLICILYGCSVPIILRKAPAGAEWYRVIGEAYVHGKMDGEAIADFEKEKTSLGEEEEDFDLR